MPRAAIPASGVRLDELRFDTSGSSPAEAGVRNRLPAHTYAFAVREERVRTGRSRSYSTVTFCIRTNEADSIQRDENTAGSRIPAGAFTAVPRKPFSWSALPL